MTTKVLVADDSITIQKIVAMAFENEDVVVEGVSEGNDAFDRMEEFQPDIVLADVDMPGLNGFELSRKIKESPLFHAVNVLLLASDFEEFNDKLFKQSKAEDHISKPFKSDDIVNKVKELLEGRSANAGMEEEGALPESEDLDVISLCAEDMVSGPEDDNTLDLLDDDLMEENIEEAISGIEEVAVGFSSPTNPDSSEQREDIPDFDITLEDWKEPAPRGAEETEEPAGDSEITQTEDKNDETPLPDFEEVPDAPSSITQESSNERSYADFKMTLGMEEEAVSKEIGETKERTNVEEISAGENDRPENVEEVSAENHEVSSQDNENHDSKSSPPVETINPEPENLLGDLEVFTSEVIPDQSLTEAEGDNQSYLSDFSGNDKAPESDVMAQDTSANRNETHLEEVVESMDSGDDALVQAVDENIRRSVSESIKSSDDPSTQANDAPVLKNEPESLDLDDDRLVLEVGDHVRRILEKSLEPAIEKELAGLSETIVQSIREVVREITPGIARDLIKEEIEKIKMDE